MQASISELYWQNSVATDYRTWIGPEIYTPPTFAAYRTKQDTALEAILAYGVKKGPDVLIQGRVSHAQRNGIESHKGMDAGPEALGRSKGTGTGIKSRLSRMSTWGPEILSGRWKQSGRRHPRL